MRRHGFKLSQTFNAQILKLFAAHAAGRTIFIRFVRHPSTRIFCAVVINQAVDDLVNLSLCLAYTLHMVQNFVDCGRTCRNRFDHILETTLNALGDFNLAFTRQELNGPHLTHIHTNRVSRTTKVRVNGSERSFGFVFDIIVGGGHRCVLA